MERGQKRQKASELRFPIPPTTQPGGDSEKKAGTANPEKIGQMVPAPDQKRF